MLGYLLLNIIFSSKKTVLVSEHIMSADKYPVYFRPKWRLLFIYLSVKEQVEVTLIFSLINYILPFFACTNFFWMVRFLHEFFFGKNSLAGIFFWELSPPLPGFLMVRPLMIYDMIKSAARERCCVTLSTVEYKFENIRVCMELYGGRWQA